MTNAKKLARNIYHWCNKNNVWERDTIIYFDDGIAWTNAPQWIYEEGKQIGRNLYEYTDRNASNYIRNAATPHILSMRFEGTLERLLYAYGYRALREKFERLFREYGWEFYLTSSRTLTVRVITEKDDDFDIWE